MVDIRFRDYLMILCKPIGELALALWDQTHFHWTDCTTLVDSGEYVVFVDDNKYLRVVEDDKGTNGILHNKSGNCQHLPISSLAVDQMWLELQDMIDLRTCTFVGLGCGTGFSLLSAMTMPLRTIVGVDMDRRCTELAQVHTTRCLDKAKTKCKQVTIVCEDIADFSFAASESTILFLYEPLQAMSKSDAHVIYKNLIHKARCSTSKELFIAYFYAGTYCGDALPALAELRAEKCHQSKYFSLFFGSHDDFYIFRIPPVIESGGSDVQKEAMSH